MYYSEPEEIESEIVKFYNSLTKKDKRRHLAIEAKKLGQEGIKYISELLGYRQNTVIEWRRKLGNKVLKKFND